MTRGAQKLDAAVERFDVASRIRGAVAVDVGAAAGGFTRMLLDHGALEVLAVDVGHGQTQGGLRRDRRVRLLEHVDWKKLPPSLEPGPFEFFTVDVSFVAARSMLRGLAFRLRDGAHGLVLVKPQFELPEGALRTGDPGDARIRERALARFRDKAEKLGFTVVDAIDSPVPGASGTLEVLAHLRFDGWRERPTSEPAPARPAPLRSGGGRAPAPRASIETRSYRWFAITQPGLEPVTEREVRALPGATEVQLVEGGVGFTGALEVGMRANLWLRTATRVLVRVDTIRAEDFATFRRRVAQLDWSPFLSPEAASRRAGLDVHVTAQSSRLFHTDAVRENVEHALRDWTRKGGARGAASVAAASRGSADENRSGVGDAAPATSSGRTGDSPEAPVRILARGSSNRWTLSADSSGELLHRRGWRTEAAQAPMRETLAAALIALCEWDPTTPFVDPMCGAGTLVLEAAALALGRAPGLDRSFAFERWPAFDAGAYERLRADAVNGDCSSLPPKPAPRILGYDRDPAAIRIARRNAERARLDAHVTLHHGALAEVRAPEVPGLVLLNPPYGKRLAEPREASALAAEVGSVLKQRFRGWRAGIVVPERAWITRLGLEPDSVTPLKNGGLRIYLVRLTVPVGDEPAGRRAVTRQRRP